MKTDILVIAGRDTNMVNRPGIEIVCDDGMCSKCIKSGKLLHFISIGLIWMMSKVKEESLG